jgi:hypothetical protein
MKVNNLISYDRTADRLYLPDHVHYENVATLGRPLFRYPWELYLSPERGINYAPTRGCYWNRCTFCDYGLNTSMPTSPWRERRIDQAVDDLRASVAETGARFVYFAVDVMSPAYLDRLSDAILDAGLDIRWSAELRLEKAFSYERCGRLAASGCVCVSFGMESGNQRILDLIDKGTQVAFMGETMKSFTAAGIAVQVMGFYDFPSETQAERDETRRFLREHSPYWSAVAFGSFLLTGTSMIAKDPARFGVRLVETEDVDVPRAIAYRIDEGRREGETKAMRSEDADASFDSDAGLFPERLRRPWAGGTDSLHTMIYYDAHGRSVLRDHAAAQVHRARPASEDQLRACTLVLTGVAKDSPFDVGKILAERQAMGAYMRQLAKIPRESTYAALQEWAAGRPQLAAHPSRAGWIMSGLSYVRLNPLAYRLLSTHSQPVILGDLLATVDEPLATRLLGYFQKLAERGYVELTLPVDAAWTLTAGSLPSTGQGAAASP